MKGKYLLTWKLNLLNFTMGALLKIYTCIFVQFLSNFSCGKTVWMRLKASPALKGLMTFVRTFSEILWPRHPQVLSDVLDFYADLQICQWWWRVQRRLFWLWPSLHSIPQRSVKLIWPAIYIALAVTPSFVYRCLTFIFSSDTHPGLHAVTFTCIHTASPAAPPPPI